MTHQIPRIIIGRLPLYLRALTRLKKDGYSFASSRELGKLLDISAAQIRKDLSHFGELGKRGKGYTGGDRWDKRAGSMRRGRC